MLVELAGTGAGDGDEDELIRGESADVGDGIEA